MVDTLRVEVYIFYTYFAIWFALVAVVVVVDGVLS